MAAIAVCVATCRRPEGLRCLLEGLADVQAPQGVQLRFVIVDNDPFGSARAIVERAAPVLPGPCRYVIEQRPGVSQARNLALRLAAGAAWAAFIDDDETPSPAWLDRLHHEAITTGAVAVSGPIRPVFPRPVPTWLAASFELCYVRPKLGRPPTELQTSNLLLDLAYLEREGLAFDETLGALGGEDTQLGNAILACGGRIGWSNAAVVVEHVTESRARLGWLLRRWTRLGGTEVLLDAKRMPRPWARLRGLVRGSARVVAGGAWFVATLPILAFGDAEPGVRRLYTVMRGVGMILAACGYVRQDYGTVAGRAA